MLKESGWNKDDKPETFFKRQVAKFIDFGLFQDFYIP
jgi:hypothetical protein